MPFKPVYKITNNIVNNISQISAGREIIERARLVPKLELKLRNDAKLHNAHSSTSIEGNRLNLEEVTALFEHRGVKATEKDKQEVLNYLQALDKIPGYAARKIVTKKELLSIHKMLTKKTLDKKEYCGVFRKVQVFVGKRIFDGTQFKTIVEYKPPKPEKVPKLVNDFLNWLNSDNAKSITPVIVAGIAHYEIARIHPFVDGNGRTARLLASLLLCKSGFDHRRFFALDDYYNDNRPFYYAALKTVTRNKGDLTEWLEYFTIGVLQSVNKVKNVVEELSLLPLSDTTASPTELTRRQIEILEKIRKKGKITNMDLRKMFQVSRQAIVKEISKLVNMKIVELVGRGRKSFYRIKN